MYNLNKGNSKILKIAIKYANIFADISEKYYRGIEDLKAIPKLGCDLLALAIAINTRYSTQIMVGLCLALNSI